MRNKYLNERDPDKITRCPSGMEGILNNKKVLQVKGHKPSKADCCEKFKKIVMGKVAITRHERIDTHAQHGTLSKFEKGVGHQIDSSRHRCLTNIGLFSRQDFKHRLDTSAKYFIKKIIRKC